MNIIPSYSCVTYNQQENNPPYDSVWVKRKEEIILLMINNLYRLLVLMNEYLGTNARENEESATCANDFAENLAAIFALIPARVFRMLRNVHMDTTF